MSLLFFDLFLFYSIEIDFHCQINALNVEIGAFLQNLRRYVSGSQQVSIGNKTVELLLDTVTFIEGQLIGKADIIDVLNETNPNFLQDLDPSHFDLQRSFMCRLCNVSYIYFSLAYPFCSIMPLCLVIFVSFFCGVLIRHRCRSLEKMCMNTWAMIPIWSVYHACHVYHEHSWNKNLVKNCHHQRWAIKCIIILR